MMRNEALYTRKKINLSRKTFLNKQLELAFWDYKFLRTKSFFFHKKILGLKGRIWVQFTKINIL